jgi:hypothetical protein
MNYRRTRLDSVNGGRPPGVVAFPTRTSKAPEPTDISRSASPGADEPTQRTNLGPLASPLAVPAGLVAIDSSLNAEAMPPCFVPVAEGGDPTAGSWGLDAFGAPVP